jgi:Phospholipase_D-nuclease N-terminal
VLLGSGFFLLIWIALWIAGFIDSITSQADRVRVMPKTVWVILILLFSGFAAIAWFIFGRPRGPAVPRAHGVGGVLGLGSPGRDGGNGFGFSRPSPPAPRVEDSGTTGWQLGGQRRSGPMAPDDDPDFLRGLGKRRPDAPGDGKPDQPA